MRAIIKIILIVIIAAVAYNWLRDQNENVKAMEYELTTTSIKKVLENPNKYDYATVSGKVKTAINIFGVAYYSLQDVDNPSNELWILPKEGFVPEEGSLQKVSGTVTQKIKLAGLEVVCLEEK